MPQQKYNQYKLSKEEITFNNEIYADFRSKYGETPEGLGWNSQHDQEVRFDILLKLIPLTEPTTQTTQKPQKATLLDVGCGFADLYTHIKKKFPGIQYTGLDINPAAIKIAQSRYPEATFIIGNILETPLPSYDMVCCSGLFATKLKDNEAFIRSMILKMGELSGKGFGFNFLQKTALPSDLAEYNKIAIRKFCRQHFSRVKMFDHYLGSEDVTIIVIK